MANIPNKFNPPNNVAPAYNFVAVSVTNGVAGAGAGGFRALFVGGLGDIAILGFDDVVATFTNVQAGSILPIMGKAIGTTSSGTTASGIIAIVG